MGERDEDVKQPTLEEKVDEFLSWLAWATDYGDWGRRVKAEVRAKLIEIFKDVVKGGG